MITDKPPYQPVPYIEVAEALIWLYDDMCDAGENRNPETGVEYDSCENARKVVERLHKQFPSFETKQHG